MILSRSKFGAKIYYSEIGGHVSTPFLTLVKEGDGVKEEVADLKETKNMHRTRVSQWSYSPWARGIFLEDADPRCLAIGRWKYCRRVRKGGNLDFVGVLIIWL